MVDFLKKSNFIQYTLLVLILLGVGFYFGRKTNKEVIKTITEYIQGDIIRDTIFMPQAVSVIPPIDTLSVIQECIKKGVYSELWGKEKVVEVIKYNPVAEDTTKIVQDWGTERIYKEVLFNNDTSGNFVLNANVRYNRLISYSYDFTPVTKQETKFIKETKLIAPFVGIGAELAIKTYTPSIIIQGGIFIKEKYGVSAMYRYDIKAQAHNVGLIYLQKF